jgi:hypothetical protein
VFKRKFIEEYDVEDWEIDTPIGWIPVSKIFKTTKYDIWRLETEFNHYIEAADTHLLLCQEDEKTLFKYLKDCIPNKTKILSKIGWIEVLSVEKLNIPSENMYDIEINSLEHIYYSNGLVSHNTTTVASYLLYEAVFNENMDIAVLANKGDTAMEILSRIKLMFEHLPWFIKPGVEEWNKRSISLTNGCKIFAAATSSSSIRGRSIQCVAGSTEVTIQENDEIKIVKIEDLYTYPSISKYKKEIDDNGDEVLIPYISNDILQLPITETKYHKIYNNIIERAKREDRRKGPGIYYEAHHILPRSLGGTDDKENLVLLTLREHFLCHKLLVKMETGLNKMKMLCAVYLMVKARSMKVSSRYFETIRKASIEHISPLGKK